MRHYLGVLVFLAISAAATGKDIRVPQDNKDLNAAVESSASGDIIYIGAGYIYVKGVVLNKNVTIIGDPNRAAVISNPTGPGILISGDASVVSLMGITIKGCMDDGIRIHQAKNAVDCILNKMEITENYGSGMNVQNHVQLNMTDCVISRNRADGIRINRMYADVVSADLHLNKCDISEQKGDGLLIQNCAPSLLTASNVVFRKNKNGLRVDLGQGATSTTLNMKTCKFEGNINGIYVSGNRLSQIVKQGVPSTISECHIDQSTSAGLKLESVQDIGWNILDSTISRNGVGLEFNRLYSPGIKIENSTIQDNSFGLVSIGSGAQPVKMTINKTRTSGNLTDYVNDAPITVMLTDVSSSSTMQAAFILSEAVFLKTNMFATTSPIKPNPLLNRFFVLSLPAVQLESILNEPGISHMMSFCRIAGQISNLLDQARDWMAIGNTQKAFACLASARKAYSWFSDRPSYPQLAEPIRQEIKNCESAFRKKPILDTNRASEYTHLSRLQDQYVEISARSEVAGLQINASNDRDQLVQSALADLGNGFAGGSGNSDELVGFLKDELANHYDRSEVAKMLAWMEASIAAKNVPEPRPNGQNYHLFMADEYNRVASYKDEVRHLTKVIDSYSSNVLNSSMVNVINRTTDLYLLQQKQPDEAIRIQRFISKYYPSTEYDYNSRLRISKILMGDKKYDQAITELNELLKILPKEYQDVPVRALLGLALIGAQRYGEARNELAGVQNKDTGELRERALYLIAYSYIIEQKYSEAVRPFTDLMNLYPNGQYSRQAKDFLAKIQENKGKEKAIGTD